MNKRASRRTFLLAAPLLLGATLGGVKWKQMHPTPTQRDLQERVHLLGSKKVILIINNQRILLPKAEFDATLTKLYLLDIEEFDAKRPAQSLSMLRVKPFSKTKIIVSQGRYKPPPLAEIGLDATIPYITRYNLHSGALIEVTALHPVTVRRLRELIARHFPAK